MLRVLVLATVPVGLAVVVLGFVLNYFVGCSLLGVLVGGMAAAR